MNDVETARALERDYYAMLAADPDLDFSLREFLKSRGFSARWLTNHGYGTHGGKRKGAGRKPSPERLIRIDARLSKNQIEFLKSIDPNLSKALRTLIDRSR